MFTKLFSINRMMKADLEAIDAVVPGTVTSYGIKVIDTEEKALESAIRMATDFLMRDEWISKIHPPVVHTTETGWLINVTIYENICPC